MARAFPKQTALIKEETRQTAMSAFFLAQTHSDQEREWQRRKE